MDQVVLLTSLLTWRQKTKRLSKEEKEHLRMPGKTWYLGGQYPFGSSKIRPTNHNSTVSSGFGIEIYK